MNNCETCKHWDTAADMQQLRHFMWNKLDDEQVAGGQDGDPTDEEVAEALKPWGECKAIVQKESTEFPAIAMLSDGSGFYASLSTLASFGCVLWEGKEVVESD
jgi:hypothetical protein